MTLRALLVDDESPARKELRSLLQPFKDVKVIGEAAHVLEALELIDNLDYSIIFLAVDMPGLNGLDLARQLQEKTDPPSVIFTTAHKEYAFSAFEVNAVDYLLKPIESERLEQAIAKVRKWRGLQGADSNSKSSARNKTANQSKPLEVVPVELRGKTILLRQEEIIYIYTDKDNVYVKTHKESYLTRFTLRDLELRFNSNLFFRSHRCYLVNMQRMRELIPYFNGTYAVVVDDYERSEIPVSRMQSRKLKELLGL
ncbi:MAG TPA: LytTR family DNA-binding domain-containing protein [Desulfitobacteriaceae bacterium]|nr:LytTR family DNA-binding domain-containing protein [Desulfitobacteriaceae bacterium]